MHSHVGLKNPCVDPQNWRSDPQHDRKLNTNGDHFRRHFWALLFDCGHRHHASLEQNPWKQLLSPGDSGQIDHFTFLWTFQPFMPYDNPQNVSCLTVMSFAGTQEPGLFLFDLRVHFVNWDIKSSFQRLTIKIQVSVCVGLTRLNNTVLSGRAGRFFCFFFWISSIECERVLISQKQLQFAARSSKWKPKGIKSDTSRKQNLSSKNKEFFLCAERKT